MHEMKRLMGALKHLWYSFIGDDRMVEVDTWRPRPTSDYSVRR
jgi:hypothetical protein